MAQPVVGQLVVNTDRQQQIEPTASSPEGLGESHGILSLPLVSALLTPMIVADGHYRGIVHDGSFKNAWFNELIH